MAALSISGGALLNGIKSGALSITELDKPMLADDIIALVTIPAVVEAKIFHHELAAKIQIAEKFVLSPTAVIAASQITYSKPSSLLAALPLCRPPYKRMWIERQGNIDGPDWDNSESRNNAKISRPLSFGTLIECITDDMTVFSVTYFWRHRMPPDRNPLEGIVVCPVGFILSVGDKTMHDLVSALPSKYVDNGEPVPDHVIWAIDRLKKRYDTISSDPRIDKYNEDERAAAIAVEERAIIVNSIYYSEPEKYTVKADWLSDLNGEQLLLISSLALINSRNNVEMVPHTFERLNKKRRRKGSPDLLSYSVVKINLSKRDQATATAAGLSGADIRRHMVRGHFKIRRGGIYWWRPYIRGHGLGEVRHAKYEVAA